jgi:5-methylcytosine-specific restriction endonuclease McrA
MTKRLYNTVKWRNARLIHLKKNPICVYCEQEGRITQATVVDHIIPHKNNLKLFWDRDNWQSLCHKCHASIKQRIENNKDVPVTGLNGWSIEEE